MLMEAEQQRGRSVCALTPSHSRFRFCARRQDKLCRMVNDEVRQEGGGDREHLVAAQRGKSRRNPGLGKSGVARAEGRGRELGQRGEKRTLLVRKRAW